MSQTPLSDNNLPVNIVASLKRRIDVLQVQNEELRKEPCKEKSNRYHLEGRAIRRLVCLTGYVGQLVVEHDRRTVLGAVSKSDADEFESEDPDDNRRYRSFKKLLVSCPSVHKLTKSVVEDHDLAFAYSQTLVVSWLSGCTPPPDPILHPYDKTGRGFYNNATGRFLCPVDHDWNNSDVQQYIQDYHPDYRVTAYSWPTFLYDGHYDARNPRGGLFKGKLLLKTFKAIFTSPTSAELDDPEQTSPNEASAHEHSKCRRTRASGEQRTRCDVAGLLNMKSTQPRAIAANSWRIMDDDFDNEVFYNHIVDFFELPPTQDAAKEVEDILL
ncbi:hypothetical protein BD769DRAFT_1671257 [Suillus cothurnatus]|nr:hypothetical protein BD769DRAFT_1671257 [Suillus cothurnatus]